MIHNRFRSVLASFFVTAILPVLALANTMSPGAGVDEPVALKLDSDWAEDLGWRSIGPASMGGRCVAIAVNPNDTSMYWIASASGGLLKTVNAGMTYTHQFDSESSVSIGHVAVAPSDANIVWVGTGEANPRNSVSYGDGVYKSTDGGDSWKRMGLKDSFQIGRIAIHPEDPDIVYVGALGRLFGTNEERGLFKTTDGGKTWDKVLYIDDKTGVVDVDMHPTDPNTLTVATYERQRDGFDTNAPTKTWGPGSGIYRTKDGGSTWMKLSKGLPEVDLGRIGIDYSRQNPDVLFAVIESERIGKLPADSAFMGMSGEDADVGARLTRVTKEGAADRAGLKKDDIVLEVGGDRILGYENLLLAIRSRRAGEKVSVELVRERELMTVECEFDAHEDGSGGLKPFASFLGGQRENVHESQGADGYQTGGIYKSIDSGDSWEKINSLNPRPMYYSQIRVDPSDESRIYVLGTSFWISEDGGASFERGEFDSGVHVDHHALWIDPSDGRHIILGNDGGIYITHDRTETWDHHNHVVISQFYHVSVDQGELYNVYGGLQDNGTWGGPNRTRDRTGPVNSDWFNIGGGDGFVSRIDPNDIYQIYSESQGGAIGWRNLRTDARGGARSSKSGYRYNWETPFLLSAHNSRILYSAGNHVFRSLDRGKNMVEISPEITLTDRGSASALAESPHDSNLLWVGTDDGAMWVTRDAGDNWTDLRLPPPADGLEDPEERREKLLVGLMASLDVDGDGTATKSEVPESLAKLFERADVDGDEKLSAYEVALSTGIPEKRPVDVLNGTWQVTVSGDAVPPIGSEFELVFQTKGEEDLRLGKLDSKKEKGKLRDVELDEESQQLIFSYTAGDELMTFDVVVGEEQFSGTLSIAGSEFNAKIEAQRDEPKKPKDKSKKSKKSDGKPLAELMPKPMWITGLEASRHERGRIYMAIDGHRSDDETPYAFVSEDEGLTWRLLTADLPRGSVRCIREDIHNQDLLYLGTEFNAWISIDRGLTWTKAAGMPTVAVHEFAQSPATGDVVLGTHGRGIWIFDATPLRQLTQETVSAEASLLAPAQVTRWRRMVTRASSGTRRFVGENPPEGAQIWYMLGSRAKSVSLSLLGTGGETLHAFEDLEKKSGLHKIDWNLRLSGGAPEEGQRRRRASRLGEGTYQLLLEVNGRSYRQEFVVVGDPDYPDIRPGREGEEEEEEEDDEEEEHKTPTYEGDY